MKPWYHQLLHHYALGGVAYGALLYEEST
jgi:hypothetical protein